METKINMDAIVEIYKNNEIYRPVLEDIFGADAFKQKLPTTLREAEDIADMEAAELLNGTRRPAGSPGFVYFNRCRRSTLALFKLRIVARALNGKDWKGDGNDYRPIFEYYVDGWHFTGDVVSSTPGFMRQSGPIVLYRSAELAAYAAETFLDLYKELLSDPLIV